MSTLRDRIASTSDARSVVVDVPEWGCSLQVHSLTTDGRIKWELACSKKRKDKVTVDPFRIRSSLLIATCRDPETGAAVFTDDDYDMLAGKSAAVVERLFDAAAKLSGITEQDEADIVGK